MNEKFSAIVARIHSFKQYWCTSHLKEHIHAHGQYIHILQLIKVYEEVMKKRKEKIISKKEKKIV